MFENLPKELQEFRQWLVASPHREPYTISRNGVLIPAEWKRKPHLLSFQEACHYARAYNTQIGFLLREEDPFCCIDLDIKDAENCHIPALWTNKEQIARYRKIVEAFDSYTELSAGGKGLHVWIKGSIGLGCRRDGVEVYSQERFIVCTGNTINSKPIAERQELVNTLVSEIRKKQAHYEAAVGGNQEEELSDYAIYEMGLHAANGDKFTTLMDGNWEGFPSQSEADLALLSMLAFYSKNDEQCKRLFLCSGLGQREKAVKHRKYIPDTLHLIRSRQYHEEKALSEAKASVELQVQKALAMQAELQTPVEQPSEQHTAQPIGLSTRNKVLTETPGGVDWPPGLTGEIARYIYSSSPRPVKEVAIVAALGLLAGICGKTFNIPQSGLNLYIILIARSAVGKEAMHLGISNVLMEVSSRQPAAAKFVDFSEFASGQALKKAIVENKSFVNVAGEFGKRMKRMAREQDGPMATLRAAMTDLYQKSDNSTIVGGLSYSNKDSSVASVSGVAYSMIGETTPDTFYGCLDESMMEDGFLSRFLLIEYTGDRPPLNPNMGQKIEPGLADRIAELCNYSLQMLARFQVVRVGREPDAAALLAQFEQECDRQINGTTDEYWRQMWNRASLKALRLASLLACADNFYEPVCNLQHVKWALHVVKKDIATMAQRIIEGDVGTGDHARESKVLSVLTKYCAKFQPGTGTGATEQMWNDRIVPKTYITSKLYKLRLFNEHRFGGSAAITATLSSLIENGYIAEVPKKDCWERFRFYGKCYQIIRLSN